MIDIKDLRENPDTYRLGCARKGVAVDIDRLIELDVAQRDRRTALDAHRADQKALAKSSGPQIGKLSGQLKSAPPESAPAIQAQIDELKAKPAQLKEQIQHLESELATHQPEIDALLLAIPQPADADVPDGKTSDDNIQLSVWNPEHFDASKTFFENRGFHPKSHVDLMTDLGMVDFSRGVKIAGSRSYVLKGHGMKLHQAILQYALDHVAQYGFQPTSVPVLVREEAMVGTAFFPGGKDQAYEVSETARGGGADMYLTGTGEVGLMGIHMDEILDQAELPIKLCTVSTCFRREAGAAGKDTAGLYRIHQFDKVEQVILSESDEPMSRELHKEMIGIVEDLLKSLGLPHRLLQCCAGDLGSKNADMIDVESWMPSRGTLNAEGVPSGEYGETHSASRLYDYQCRRLNTRYRPGGEAGKGPTVFCHSLNNTVAASPRILIPLVEMYQNEDGSITVPEKLRPYMGGLEMISNA